MITFGLSFIKIVDKSLLLAYFFLKKVLGFVVIIEPWLSYCWAQVGLYQSWAGDFSILRAGNPVGLCKGQPPAKIHVKISLSYFEGGVRLLL